MLMTKITSQFTNPFFWLEAQLSHSEDKQIDIPFLKMFAYELEKFNVVFDTFGDLIGTLEWLEGKGMVILTKDPDGSILIKKAYY